MVVKKSPPPKPHVPQEHKQPNNSVETKIKHMQERIKELNQPFQDVYQDTREESRTISSIFSTYIASDGKTSLQESLQCAEKLRSKESSKNGGKSAQKTKGKPGNIDGVMVKDQAKNSTVLRDLPAKSSVLYDTDLIVFRDDYKGELPLNGIKHKDFKNLEHLYLDIINGKTCIEFDREALSDHFCDGVLRDFKILLMRPAGREIINQVLHADIPVVIKRSTAGSGMEMQKTGANQYKFILSVQEHMILGTINNTTSGSKEVTPRPRFIEIGHELIHLLHFVENADPEKVKFGDKEKQIELLDAAYHNFEEQHTICGFRRPIDREVITIIRHAVDSKTALFEVLQKPEHFSLLNEQYLSAQYGLPQRTNHRGGWFPPGIDPAFVANDTRTPLAEALLEGTVDNALMLIERGADIYAVFQHEGTPFTPLELAFSSDDYSPIWEAMEKYGADFSSRPDRSSNTPLIQAILSKSLHAAKWLLAKGVDASIPNARGITALEIAMDMNAPQDIIELLERRLQDDPGSCTIL
jgi:hypothetical protein